MSNMFGKTLREGPTEADLISHKLMQRAGFIHQVSAGVYSYLPLGWRSLRKIEQIVREELDEMGSQELRMSVLQPRDLWQRSGRDTDWGPEMFRLTDRHDRSLVLGPTHEELLTLMVKANIQSYRDLPQILYQIQTKFRDEPRPRGGLLRVREFDMKDAYSLDMNQEGLDVSYTKMVKAYDNIFARCGIKPIMVEADSGAIGGRDSQEFVMLAASGEDTILMCRGCSYAANQEKASFPRTLLDSEDEGVLESIHTPGTSTIMEISDLLGIPQNKILKVVAYTSTNGLVIAAIRGDLEVNEIKLANILDAKGLRMASPTELKAAGLVAGYVSVVGINDIKIVADESINSGNNFVVGANKDGYHMLNANLNRDFNPDIIADIARAQTGYPCPNCNSTLESQTGIEVGHVFKLGTRFSESLGASFPDEQGIQQPIVMGSYGIGIGRLLAASIETNHDAHGMMLPVAIAPYQVSLIALNIENQDVATAADLLYQNLTDTGLEVLFDDRTESAGVKFNDADLLGLPVRTLISPRNLKKGVVELRSRNSGESNTVKSSDAVKYINNRLGVL